MASHMRTSRAGLELIKQFEGYRPHDQELPDNRFIVGYGHVRAQKGDERLNKAEAEALLREHDLPKFELLVENSVLAPLNQNEFDALVSFAFNIGMKAFVQSDVVAYLNGGNRLAAAAAMDVWRKARIGGRVQVIDVLVRRRAAEKALFLTAPGNMPSAASALYRPVSEPVRRLAAPVKPREIIVERAAATDLPAEQKRTAPEEAAESLKRNIQEILNRDEPSVAAPRAANDQAAKEPHKETRRDSGQDHGRETDRDTGQDTDGATPEEIEAAIMDLAGQNDGRASLGKSMWPQREDRGIDAEERDTAAPLEDTREADNDDEAGSDLPPPPYLERVVTRPLRTAPSARTVQDLPEMAASKLIDDTEDFVPPKSRAGMSGIGEGVHLQEPLVETPSEQRGLSAAPYGLLSLIGAGIAGYGGADLLGLIASGETVENDLAVYLPPFLILLGAILFVVMGYYFLRTLLTRD